MTRATSYPAEPAPTDRLAFRRMTVDDLDAMAALLGDPVVMRYYPRPYVRAGARDWIAWNQGLYDRLGHGLWIVTVRATGEFAGDCGLTPQEVDGVTDLEVGYHVRADLQGRGYATEAAAACLAHARDVLGAPRLIAIINPQNVPSQRVAEKIGLRHDKDTIRPDGLPARVYATEF
jgi:RimJ/RimL family protein N-acetyltransferase